MDYHDEEFRRHQLRLYLRALNVFRFHRSIWRDRIPEFSVMSLERRYTEIRRYENILIDLSARPRFLPFDVSSNSELDDFCDAIVIAWRLLPDTWTGLQMMIEYLAENMLAEDLVNIREATLVVLKEVAQKEDWQTNPAYGPLFFSAPAEAVVRRVSRNTDESSATAISRSAPESRRLVRLANRYLSDCHPEASKQSPRLTETFSSSS